MKKIIMMVAAALIFVAPASMAQKIKAESLVSKIEKSDATIANAKKAGKASTWMSRANVYLDALQAPTKSLFTNMDVQMLKLTDGEPKSVGSVDIKGATYQTLVYPYYTAYAQNGKVVGWEVTKFINPNANDIILEAFNKAYEIDDRQESKAKKGLEVLANYNATIGDVSNTLSMYETGADAYVQVYKIQSAPALNDPNPMMMYYAGYLYTIGGAEKPELYAKGVEALNKAIEVGYADSELTDENIDDKDKGNIYYYLYYCYYGQKEQDSSYLESAKQALISGVEKFPKNQRIIDALTQLYTTEKGIGDPSDLINLIDGAISADPSNADLWYARGRVYFALEDFDNSIASFQKVTELKPEVFDGFFYLGLFYIYKGDAENDAMSTKTYTENSQYEADLKSINAVYGAAIPILERALEIKPDDFSTVEYLKSLCFRLRDEEGIMDKYNKYNEMFKTMQANQ